MTTGINLGTSNADWQMWQQEQMQAAKSKMRQSGYVSKTQETKQEQYVSEKNNVCTDGNDDGKVGFFSAAGNIIQGIGKGLVNTVKNAIKHPFKTALMIGACCIPVVGPFIAGGLAIYGIAKGAYTIGTGVSQALKADNDAEAKDMWEQVGEGTFEVGASALALKGAAGALKSQLNGGSTTVTKFKAAKEKGASASELAEIAVKEGMAETGSSIVKTAEAVKKNTYDKAKNEYNAIKENGLKATAKGHLDKAATKAGEVAKNGTEKFEEFKTKASKEGRAAAKAQKTAAKTKVETIKQNAETTGSTIKKTANGGLEIKDAQGNIAKYNSKGEMISETKTYKGTDGKTITKTKTYKNGVEVKTVREEVKYDADGKVVNGTRTTTNENGLTKTETLNEYTNKTKNFELTKKGKYDYSKETVLKEGNVTTTEQYVINGKTVKDPSLLQKAELKLNTTNAGIEVNKFIDKKSFTVSTKFGNLTIKTPDGLMFASPLVNNED